MAVKVKGPGPQPVATHAGTSVSVDEGHLKVRLDTGSGIGGGKVIAVYAPGSWLWATVDDGAPNAG